MFLCDVYIEMLSIIFIVAHSLLSHVSIIIRLVRSITRLPIVIKGVLCAEVIYTLHISHQKSCLSLQDAIKAAQFGAQAVIVSNHGGRQLDCAPVRCTFMSIYMRIVDFLSL